MVAEKVKLDGVERLAAFYDAFAAAWAMAELGSHAALARDAGVPTATVSGIANRSGAEPRPSTVFRLERSLKLLPGELSHHLGYLPLERWETDSVEAALRGERRLRTEDRRHLIDMYRMLLELNELRRSVE